MKRLPILIFFLLQIHTICGQNVTIENFSGQTIEFWTKYFAENTDLHPLEGVYLHDSKGISKSDGSEFSNTRKNVIVKINDSFYRLIDSPIAAFTSVKETKKGYKIRGEEFDNRGSHLNFWGEQIEIISNSRLMLNKYPVDLNVKSKIEYHGNKYFSSISIFVTEGSLLFEEEINGYKFIHGLQNISRVQKPTDPNLTSTGTGFQISNTHIVTNSHVINDSKTITIEVNNNEIELEVEINDVRNDLAILSLPEGYLEKPNYGFNSDKTPIGTEVFTLGFPLINSMGSEIKLTNGIVSSTKGFADDITTIQTSIPVHPGNSGGPLFNDHGQVVGIISSKHTEAENASYAIKLKYLINILDDLEIKLPSYTQKSDLIRYAESFGKSIHLIKSYD